MNTARHHPERIAVGIDGSIASHAAVRWAIDHARPGDTVTLVHAWETSSVTIETGLIDPDDDSGPRSFVRHELARVAALPRDQDVTIAGDVLHGDARHSLCDTDVDLLVVGSGGHGRLAGALLGSISAHLAQHSRIPLVIVPNPCEPGHPARSS